MRKIYLMGLITTREQQLMDDLGKFNELKLTAVPKTLCS